MCSSDLVPLSTLLAEADIVSMHVPLTEETAGMCDARFFAAMRPGAIFVNTTRGGVVRQDDLVAALRAGTIAGAALDTFVVEPLPKESLLWEMPNVIVSPHSASTVAAENGRIVDIFLDNLERFLNGRPLRNKFEPARGY